MSIEEILYGKTAWTHTIKIPVEDPTYKPFQVGNMTRQRIRMGGAMSIEPTLNFDYRGEFVEYFNESLRDLFPNGVAQVSRSVSKKNVLRGIHFQVGMGKLISVEDGAARFVLVDLRKDSPTFKTNLIVNYISGHYMLYVPSGIGIAFRAEQDNTTVRYLHNTTYDASKSFGIAWDDPNLNIGWGLEPPILSKKDWRAMSFAEWLARPESDLL